MTLRPAELALTWVTRALSDELAGNGVAAGSVLTWFTSTEDFWTRPGAFDAGAGNGGLGKGLGCCGVKLLPEELFPELEGSLVAGGSCFTPFPSTDDVA